MTRQHITFCDRKRAVGAVLKQLQASVNLTCQCLTREPLSRKNVVISTTRAELQYLGLDSRNSGTLRDIAIGEEQIC